MCRNGDTIQDKEVPLVILRPVRRGGDRDGFQGTGDVYEPERAPVSAQSVCAVPQLRTVFCCLGIDRDDAARVFEIGRFEEGAGLAEGRNGGAFGYGGIDTAVGSDTITAFCCASALSGQSTAFYFSEK